MIPTPADRRLARIYVATMQTPGVETPAEPEVPEEQLWEFAMLMVAVTRKAGWSPPVEP